jgi:hypothetical protein
VRRRYRQGFIDVVRSAFGFWPYRCRDCKGLFHAALRDEPEPEWISKLPRFWLLQSWKTRLPFAAANFTVQRRTEIQG